MRTGSGRKIWLFVLKCSGTETRVQGVAATVKYQYNVSHLIATSRMRALLSPRMRGGGALFGPRCYASRCRSRLGELLQQAVQVAGQAIHAVHQHRVPFARERQQRIELRLYRVFPDALSINYVPFTTPVKK